MSDELVLLISDLRQALDKALSAAEACLGGEVVLPGDHYWHLPVDSAFDLSREPAELTVGQLADDLAELSSTAGPEPEAVWHDLGHLVGLVRAIEKLARP